MSGSKAKPDSSDKRRIGIVPILIGGVGVVMIVQAFVSLAVPKQSEIKPLEITCDEAWAEKFRHRATDAGLLRGQELNGVELVAVVNPVVWRRATLDNRKALALALACQSPRGFAMFNVRFRTELDGADLMNVSTVQLYEMARGEFVPSPSTPSPDSFLGRKWGTGRTNEMKPVGEGGDVYATAAPHPPYLGVQPYELDFQFERGRLVAGDLYFREPEQFQALQKQLLATYGAPSLIYNEGATEAYEWNWKKAKRVIFLRYTPEKGSTWLRLEQLG